MAIQKTEEQHSAFFHLQRQVLFMFVYLPITERRRRRDSSPPLTSRDQVFDMRALVNCCHGADHKRARAARTRVPKPQHASTAAATATLAFLAGATEATTPRLTAPTNADVRKNVHTFSCALPTAPPSSPPNTASTAPNDTDATATAMAYIVPSSDFPSSSSSSPTAAVQNSMNAHAAAPATTGKTTAGNRSP
uniref:Uncharacterized protein n=1 Tax=Oryza nivara TaxID=4536 RepID=A0A0E0GD05_ORYNI